MYKNLALVLVLSFVVLIFGFSFVYASTNSITTSQNTNTVNIIITNTITANAPANTITNSINTSFSNHFYSFIETYIPDYIIKNSSFINETYNGKSYTIMWLNSSGTTFIVFNNTNNSYSFVLNSTAIKNILTPYLIQKYYPSNSTLKNLTTLMNEYRSEAQPPLSDCLVETGTANYQCSYSSGLINCLLNTCQTVPNCGGNPKMSVLSKFGSSSPFAYGILNFSVQYGELNASYNKYLKLAETINPSNFSQNIYEMENLLNNISTLSIKIPQNPIFPGPSNLNPAQVGAQCSQYTSNNGPWYCYAVGFCEYTSFNSTILSQLIALVNNLANSPASQSSINSISYTSSMTGYSYYEPVAIKVAQAQLNAMLNASSSKYNSALSKLEFINSHLNNTALSMALFNLTSTYNSIISKGVNQNISEANAMLNAAIANALNIYSKYSASYISLYNSAQNVTSLITIQELDYQNVPSSLAELAAIQSSLNSRLNAQLNPSSLSSLSASESSIYAEAKSLSAPFSMAEFVKKNTLIMPMLSLINAPINQKILIAPYLAFILPFVLGLIIIILFYYSTYYRLSKKNKIRKSPSVKRAWLILFMILFIIVLVWASVTVFYAESANTFLPISAFLSNLNQNKNVYIIANSTITNNSYYSCISALKSTLEASGKTPIIVNSSGYNCTLSSLKGSSCYSYMLNSDSPMIIISNGNSTIIHKGLYGSTLYASGEAAEGSSCLLNNIIKTN